MFIVSYITIRQQMQAQYKHYYTVYTIIMGHIVPDDHVLLLLPAADLLHIQLTHNKLG